MSSSDPQQRLRDILDNIARIRSYTKGVAPRSRATDHKTQDAVERCLERICEAARKLGDGLDLKYPEVEFQKLRQLGSVLRHDYSNIESAMLWRFIRERLDPLEHACLTELAEGTE